MRKSVNIVEDQEIVKKSVLNRDYDLYDGRHEPIISEELFYLAQQRCNDNPRLKLANNLTNPLATIFRCKCGCVMGLIHSKGELRYECKNHKKCGTSSAKYEDVIKDVVEALKQGIEDVEVVVDDSNHNEIERHKEQIEYLKKRLEELEAKEVSIWEKYSLEGMPKTIFERLRDNCEEEIASIKKAVDKAYNEMPEEIDYEEKLFGLHKALEYMSDDSISAKAKNDLLKSVIDRIEYSRGKALKITKEEADKMGVKTKKGWYSPKYTLDIHLKF